MLNKKGPKIELCGTPYIIFQGMREIDFEVKEPWNTEKSATMVGRQEKFLNSRRSRMIKTVTFWLGWQSFNSFFFETFLFFFFAFAFYFWFGGRGGEGWGAWPSQPPRCHRPWFSHVLYDNQIFVCYFRFRRQSWIIFKAGRDSP